MLTLLAPPLTLNRARVGKRVKCCRRTTTLPSLSPFLPSRPIRLAQRRGGRERGGRRGAGKTRSGGEKKHNPKLVYTGKKHSRGGSREEPRTSCIQDEWWRREGGWDFTVFSAETDEGVRTGRRGRCRRRRHYLEGMRCGVCVSLSGAPCWTVAALELVGGGGGWQIFQKKPDAPRWD